MKRFVEAGGLRFGVLADGPRDGPLALLLHGFPDHAGTWRRLQPVLAGRGYHAVAPWMRGYAPTDRGERHHLRDLVGDANALHQALGGDREAVLIGHDWGAAVAYRAAVAAPDRWRRIVTMAVPPEPVLADARRDPRQLARSWYMLAAQVPGAEHLLGRTVRTLWRRWSPGRRPQRPDLEGVASALPDVAHRRAALDYYRSHARDALRGAFPARRGVTPRCPVLYLHGVDDGCIRVAHARDARTVLTGALDRVEIVDDAGHFLHLDRPEVVNAAVVDFLDVP